MIENKVMGSGAYQPTVFAHFPRLARGHALRHGRCCVAACVLNGRTGKGELHFNQRQNRTDWEESVGIKPTKSARSARAHRGMTQANVAAVNPKGRD
jgi:hypothetical protein